MVEAWILVIFCLSVCIPIYMTERGQNAQHYRQYAKRYLRPRISHVQRQEFTA